MASGRSKPSNEVILQQLRDGTAKFELLSPMASTSPRFFARIGSSLGGGSPAMKKVEHYSVQKVAGDGRCMFRALVKGMAKYKGLALSPREERDDADELRMAVKEVICDDDKEQRQYEEPLIAITVDESLKRYCQRIERSDFWGGESELLVLSKLIHQPIIVYIPEQEVLEKALGVWDLQVIPFNSPVAEASNYDPELEMAFICHLHDHWFCVRKVNGEWYNFNSLYAAPEHLSKFYLSAFLDTLRGSGWSIFLVRGNFPKDCPIPSSNAFGQWLTPDDAERITKSCNEMEAHPERQEPSRAAYSDQFINEADVLAAQEEHDLNAAIAASLMDSSTFTAGTSSIPDYSVSPGSPAIGSDSVAMAASLLGSAFSQGSVPIQDPANLVSSAAVGSQLNANESSSNDPHADSNATDGSMATISSDPSEAREPEPSQDNKDR